MATDQNNNNFQYFTFVMVFVLIIYLMILMIFLCIRRNEIKNRYEREQSILNRNNIAQQNPYTFDWTTNVDEIAKSGLGRAFYPVILVTRLASVLYFFIGGLIIKGTKSREVFYFFDGWNLLFVFFYFVFTSVLTIMAIFSLRTRVRLGENVTAIEEWSYYPRLAAVTAHLMFEVSGPASILILFAQGQQVKQDSVELRDVNVVIFLLLLLDMALNKIRVRFDQFPACIAWVIVYFLYIWPAVFTGFMATWPYEQLRTDTAACFLYYTLIFLITFLGYVAWYMAYKLKKVIVHIVIALARGDTINWSIFTYEDDPFEVEGEEASALNGNNSSGQGNDADKDKADSEANQRDNGHIALTRKDSSRSTTSHNSNSSNSGVTISRNPLFEIREDRSTTNNNTNNSNHVNYNNNVNNGNNPVQFYNYPPPQYPGANYPPGYYGNAMPSPSHNNNMYYNNAPDVLAPMDYHNAYNPYYPAQPQQHMQYPYPQQQYPMPYDGTNNNPMQYPQMYYPAPQMNMHMHPNIDMNMQQPQTDYPYPTQQQQQQYMQYMQQQGQAPGQQYPYPTAQGQGQGQGQGQDMNNVSGTFSDLTQSVVPQHVPPPPPRPQQQLLDMHNYQSSGNSSTYSYNDNDDGNELGEEDVRIAAAAENAQLNSNGGTSTNSGNGTARRRQLRPSQAASNSRARRALPRTPTAMFGNGDADLSAFGYL